jgi:rRNA-processing protein FCF1
MLQEPNEPSALRDESGLHHKDLWLVRLAVASGAEIVTEDGKLARTLRDKGIPCADSSVIAGR